MIGGALAWPLPCVSCCFASLNASVGPVTPSAAGLAWRNMLPPVWGSAWLPSRLSSSAALAGTTSAAAALMRSRGGAVLGDSVC